MIATVPATSEHRCTGRCDHTPVESYATRAAVERWNARANGHGPMCGCLPCADLRKHFKRPALLSPWPTMTTVETVTVVTTT